MALRVLRERLDSLLGNAMRVRQNYFLAKRRKENAEAEMSRLPGIIERARQEMEECRAQLEKWTDLAKSLDRELELEGKGTL